MKMSKDYSKRSKLIGVLLIVSGLVYCQPQRGVVVVSPQVNSDNAVVFRYLAPNANEVKLNAQFEKTHIPMTKDSSGVWSVKVGPVKPDMYPYCFVVDGISVADPRNASIFPNEGFQNSLVEITGNNPLVHTLQNVPHGTVSYRYYNSPELGIRPVVIYTPPAYEENINAKYPVLYFKNVNGELKGFIRTTFLLPNEGTDPVCTECDGDLKNTKVVGMKIIWDFKKEGDKWVDGKILDPGNGNVYSSSIWLIDPDTLKVRGYVGPFYRSQVWRRAN
jgi:hypothetical protein